MTNLANDIDQKNLNKKAPTEESKLIPDINPINNANENPLPAPPKVVCIMILYTSEKRTLSSSVKSYH